MDEWCDHSNSSRFHGNMSFSSSWGVCSCRRREVPRLWRPGLPFLRRSEAPQGKSDRAGAQTPWWRKEVRDWAQTELRQPSLADRSHLLGSSQPTSTTTLWASFQVTPSIKWFLLFLHSTKRLGETIARERWRTWRTWLTWFLSRGQRWQKNPPLQQRVRDNSSGPGSTAPRKYHNLKI